MSLAYPLNCPVCGAYINPERDLDPAQQRLYELHLQGEALKLQSDQIAEMKLQTAAWEEIADAIANRTIMVQTP